MDNYLPLSENEKERFEAEIRQDDHKEVGSMIQTLSEALADREALGRAEGVALGKIIATREAIIFLAQSLHKELPTSFREGLHEIEDIRRLYEILEAVPKVSTLEELMI